MASPDSPTRIDFDTGHPDAAMRTTGSLVLSHDSLSLNHDHPLVCVPSVPGLMTAPDFCMFVRPLADTLLHVRMLRPTTEINRYVVVAQFKSPADARAFAQVYEGKCFLQGLIEDTCHLCEVQSVDIHSSAASTGLVPVHDANENSGGDPARGPTAGSSGGEDSRSVAAVGVEELSFPGSLLFPVCERHSTAGTLKTTGRESGHSAGTACPVCLEPLDVERSSLVTTLCNHTMHVQCLAQWDLHSCPVCRHTHDLMPEASTCMTCKDKDDLWMCVVCAYVGCGIYKSKHARSHFQETQHPFAMNLQECCFWTGDKIKAGSVWDYVSERFVNRLLTSDDGKVVEVSRDGQGVDARARSCSPGESGCRSSRRSVAQRVLGGNGRARLSRLSGGGGGGSSSNGSSIRGTGGSSGAALEDDGFLGGGREDGKDDEEDEDGGEEGEEVEEEEERALHAALYASRMDAVVSDYRLRLECVEAEHASVVSSLQGELRAQAGSLEALRGAVAALERAQEESKAHKRQLTRRATEAEREARGLREQNGFLKSLNESLLRDKRLWQEEVERLAGRLAAQERACAEKDEQMRDVMLHLEAQARVAGVASPLSSTTPSIMPSPGVSLSSSLLPSPSSSSPGCRVNASASASAAAAAGSSLSSSSLLDASGGDIVGVGPSPRQKLAMKTKRR